MEATNGAEHRCGDMDRFTQLAGADRQQYRECRFHRFLKQFRLETNSQVSPRSLLLLKEDANLEEVAHDAAPAGADDKKSGIALQTRIMCQMLEKEAANTGADSRTTTKTHHANGEPGLVPTSSSH